MNDRPLISIIIPSFNGINLLGDTLNSIAKNNFNMDKVEVVVCDDGSTDGTYEKYLNSKYQFSFKMIKHLKSGQSAATNSAIKNARGEYLLFSAQDIIFDRKLISEHLTTHSDYANEEIVVLGYLPYAKNIAISPFMFYSVNGGWQFAYYQIKNHQDVPPQFLYAPNVSMKREVIMKIGLFQESLPFGSQDTELAIRLKLSDTRIVFNANAVGYHNHIIYLNNFLSRQEKAGASVVKLSKMHPGFEDEISNLDLLLKSYLSISDLELINEFEKIEILEKAIEKIPDYQGVWLKALHGGQINQYELNSFREIKKLFKSYDFIMRYYWGKGYWQELVKGHINERLNNILKLRLLRMHLDDTHLRTINIKLKQYDFKVKIHNSMVTKIIYGSEKIEDYYDYCLDLLANGSNSIKNIIVLKRGLFDEASVAKLKEVVKVVDSYDISIGIIESILGSRSKYIIVNNINYRFIDKYNEHQLINRLFMKLEKANAISGNIITKTEVKYGYKFANSDLIELRAKRNTINNFQLKPIDCVIPEYFALRNKHYSMKPYKDDLWFVDLSKKMTENDNKIYHISQLSLKKKQFD